MKHRKVKHRPKQWSRAKLYQECRAAPVVWGVLEDMAYERGSPVITPTREQLTAATGIKTLWLHIGNGFMADSLGKALGQGLFIKA